MNPHTGNCYYGRYGRESYPGFWHFIMPENYGRYQKDSGQDD
jgi:hypothetical protein